MVPQLCLLYLSSRIQKMPRRPQKSQRLQSLVALRED